MSGGRYEKKRTQYSFSIDIPVHSNLELKKNEDSFQQGSQAVSFTRIAQVTYVFGCDPTCYFFED